MSELTGTLRALAEKASALMTEGGNWGNIRFIVSPDEPDLKYASLFFGCPLRRDNDVAVGDIRLEEYTPEPDPPPGAWVAYFWDMGVHVNAVFGEELEAHRHANGSGYLRVGFVPYGAEVSEVLK